MSENKILKPQQPEREGFLYSKKYKFYYLDNKKIKDETLKEFSILGEVDLTHELEVDDFELAIELISRDGRIKKYKVNQFNGKINEKSAFIYVGDNNYILINSAYHIRIARLTGLLVPIIFFTSMSVAIFSACKTIINVMDTKGGNLKLEEIINSSKNPILEDASDWNGELPGNNRAENNENLSKNEISIPGYSYFYINDKNTNIDLINPGVNDVYFKYILEKNGLKIYESNMIEPGKALSLNIYEMLYSGTHNIDFIIETYDTFTMEKYNGATQKVEIEIK